jgi:short-subunit dehydrogenase
MAIELAPFNIQVNAIAPGWIETDLTAPVKTTPLYQEIITRTPAGRWGNPDECAGAAVFLASRASDFVTGRTGYDFFRYIARDYCVPRHWPFRLRRRWLDAVPGLTSVWLSW